MLKKLYLLLVLVLVGCGENQDSTSPSTQFGPPENMKALSVNATTVGLQWTAPTGQPDSLGGYVVQVGNSKDTLGPTAVSFMADSLTPGEKTFTVYARRKSGTLSDGAVIKWAAAARFDVPYVIYEYKTNQTSVLSALDVGTATTDPAATTVSSADAPKMDLYLFGGNGGVQEGLQLQSPSLLATVWNATYFSTVSYQSTGLDQYLASFPASSTFTLDRVSIVDNTIYFARVAGDYYVRLHVHVQSGAAFPARAVEIRVSLQRFAGLLYAVHEGSPAPANGLLGFITLPGVKL